MAKNSVAGLLTSVDDLFSTQESRDEAKLERVINPVSYTHLTLPTIRLV